MDNICGKYVKAQNTATIVPLLLKKIGQEFGSYMLFASYFSWLAQFSARRAKLVQTQK
jgi:hypothetical protein